MLIYLAGSESILQLFTASPDVTGANNRDPNGQISEHLLYKYSHF